MLSQKAHPTQSGFSLEDGTDCHGESKPSPALGQCRFFFGFVFILKEPFLW